MSAHPESAPSVRRQETRDRLEDAALEIFAEVGLPGASVEMICARAGFTRGAFYSNFSSKEQLFIAALDREFTEHARELSEKARELEQELRGNSTAFTPEDATRYVIEFLSPSHDHETWCALELELALLAMREPSLVAEQIDFKTGLYREIAKPVEQIVAAAGRRFVIPVERALPVLGGVYEEALRKAGFSGPASAEAIDDMGERIAELLFALTEPLN